MGAGDSPTGRGSRRGVGQATSEGKEKRRVSLTTGGACLRQDRVRKPGASGAEPRPLALLWSGARTAGSAAENFP